MFVLSRFLLTFKWEQHNTSHWVCYCDLDSVSNCDRIEQIFLAVKFICVNSKVHWLSMQGWLGVSPMCPGVIGCSGVIRNITTAMCAGVIGNITIAMCAWRSHQVIYLHMDRQRLLFQGPHKGPEADWAGASVSTLVWASAFHWQSLQLLAA